MTRKRQKKRSQRDPGGKNARENGGEGGTEAESEAPASLGRRVWDQVGPIAVAVLIALAIRAVVIESYYVPSGSMLPTLYIGDHVFVSKFTFGARIPFTHWTFPAVRDPERGEIVVFALGRRPSGEICPLDECPDSRADGFVKRVVGLPGDRIEYREGRLFLNGALVEDQDTGETFQDEHGIEYRVLEEDLDGCKHAILDRPGTYGLSRSLFTVPPGRYFMLGDNRDNSNDSRGWGTVPRASLKGPVLINYWSWNNQSSWLGMLNPFTWVRLLWSDMYWDRIGMTYSCRD